jgi:hypothetical protein
MLKNKSLKALNILKFVSSIDWCADSTVLLNLYRSLIRSKLDYGCIVYDSDLVSETILIGELYNFNSESGWSPLLLQKCIPRVFELENLNPFSIHSGTRDESSPGKHPLCYIIQY